jgi:hypothetical protein
MLWWINNININNQNELNPVDDDKRDKIWIFREFVACSWFWDYQLQLVSNQVKQSNNNTCDKEWMNFLITFGQTMKFLKWKEKIRLFLISLIMNNITMKTNEIDQN